MILNVLQTNSFVHEDEAGTYTEDKKHEIRINGELKTERILKGSYEVGEDLPENMKKFVEGLESIFFDDFKSVVSWEITMGPTVIIYRWDEDEKQWRDISLQREEVLVGQKVRMKAEVIRKSYESREGKWSIEGEKIADYLVLPSVNNPQTGEPKELTEDQYNKPEINCEEFGDGMHSCKNL